MKRKVYTVGVVICMTAFLSITHAFGEGAAALQGTVSSSEEGKMEGVLVTAKEPGATIALTVVSDRLGYYEFPSGRLKPGNYNLKVRAVGYDLNDPGAVPIEVGKTQSLDLKLHRTSDLASQLTNGEWLMSAPGTPEQKLFRASCVNCHAMTRIFRSTYNATTFMPVLKRMGFNIEAAGPEEQVAANANQVALTGRVYDPFGDSRPDAQSLADYLSSINLSSSKDGKWPFELKTFPRLRGPSTRVIITEYDLPRKQVQPHDVIVDEQGMVWYADFGNSGTIGRLDPKTGEVKDWQVPFFKPKGSKSMLDLRLDRSGNPWFAIRQGGIGKFDKRTEKFTTWAVPAEYNFDRMNVSMIALNPDGTAWFKDTSNLKVHRLDPETGKIVTYSMPNDFYGIESDSHGNLYMASLNSHKIGYLHADTSKWDIYDPPTPKAAPRRGAMDDKDRFWFGEYMAGQIGMFDPATKKITEWPVEPRPWSGPYDVVVDKNGEVWAGGEFTDYVFRLNPKTGSITTYLMPTVDINMRNVTVDNATTPVTFWVGENHQAKVAKLEPLN